jgi:predicted nucleic-acid-binding Zn-ribbon protein
MKWRSIKMGNNGYCPKCGSETYVADDQFGRWWRECTEYDCKYSELLSDNGRSEEHEEEVCSGCGGGGCVHCEPHRFIEGPIYL